MPSRRFGQLVSVAIAVACIGVAVGTAHATSVSKPPAEVDTGIVGTADAPVPQPPSEVDTLIAEAPPSVGGLWEINGLGPNLGIHDQRRFSMTLGLDSQAIETSSGGIVGYTIPAQGGSLLFKNIFPVSRTGRGEPEVAGFRSGVYKYFPHRGFLQIVLNFSGTKNYSLVMEANARTVGPVTGSWSIYETVNLLKIFGDTGNDAALERLAQDGLPPGTIPAKPIISGTLTMKHTNAF